MAFHVPFNQRNRRPPVVYIGFETPRNRRKFNWWAFHGFWMTLVSGILALTVHPAALLACPVTLLISMRGLKKRPRRLATLSTLMALGGSTVLGVGLFQEVSHHANQKHLRALRLQSAVQEQQIDESEMIIDSAIEELRDYQSDHEGQLPDWVQGNMLLLKHVDAWGNSLRFDAEEEQAFVRSAGPDARYDTQDDLTEVIRGKIDLNVNPEL